MSRAPSWRGCQTTCSRWLDEACHEFQRIEDADALLALLEEFDNALLMRAFSKAFGPTGMCIWYCMAHPDVIDMVDRPHIALATASHLNISGRPLLLVPPTRVSNHMRLHHKLAGATCMAGSLQGQTNPLQWIRSGFNNFTTSQSPKVVNIQTGGSNQNDGHAPLY